LKSEAGAFTLPSTMSWLDALERRFGFLAIPGLVRIIVAFNALVFVIARLNPFLLDVLDLNRSRIWHGEVWRLVTYIFIPGTTSLLWIAFFLGFLWFVGDGLERAWGAFRLNLFYLVGMLGTTFAAFIFGDNFSNVMLNASLFFAFAHFYPDETIYVFFLLPAKIKWVAWASAALILVGFVTGPNAYRMSLLAAFSNYFIFFGPGLWRQARHRRETKSRRQRFDEASRSPAESLHRCAVCNATELSDATLEFRVARDGEEYCLAHLPSVANALTE
jgi:membrane associated rhomboid family serine protease